MAEAVIIDTDIAAAREAEPGDLAAIRALVLILDDLAETQRVTRMLQAEAQLALGRHLEAHPRAERAGLVPGWTLTLERPTTKRYDSAMVRARVAGVLADEVAMPDFDVETGEIVPVPPATVVARTCALVWPLVGAHTEGFSGWRSQALDRIGIKASRYVVNDDDAPPRGRATRTDSGQPSSRGDALTVTELRLFPCDEAPTVVRLPATAMCVYSDRRYYRENLPKRPRRTWVALDLEALIAADVEWWDRLDGSSMVAGPRPLHLRLCDLVTHVVAQAEASRAPFGDWPGAVGWQGRPMPEAACRIVVDATALRKALAFELARRYWSPVDELALVASAGQPTG